MGMTMRDGWVGACGVYGWLRGSPRLAGWGRCWGPALNLVEPAVYLCVFLASLCVDVVFPLHSSRMVSSPRSHAMTVDVLLEQQCDGWPVAICSKGSCVLCIQPVCAV